MSALQYYPLAQLRDRTDRGTTIKACCPFHQDTDPSLSITLAMGDRAKGTEGLWHCHACHAGGRLFRGYLVQKGVMLPDELAYPDRPARVARVGPSLAPVRPAPPPRERRLVPAPLAVVPPEEIQGVLDEVWRRCRDRFYGSTAQSYLWGRGIDDAQAGHMPDGRWLADLDQVVLQGVYLTNRGGYVSERWQDRVVFPYTTAGQVCSFYGRSLYPPDPAGKRRKHEYSGTAVAARDIRWNKGLGNEASLMALENSSPEPGEIRTLMVVEGLIDAYAGAQLGYPSIVALGSIHHPHVVGRIPLDVRVLVASDRELPKGARIDTPDGSDHLVDWSRIDHFWIDRDDQEALLVRVPAGAVDAAGDLDWDQVSLPPEHLPPGEKCFRWLRQELGSRVRRQYPPPGHKDFASFTEHLRDQQVLAARARTAAGPGPLRPERVAISHWP